MAEYFLPLQQYPVMTLPRFDGHREYPYNQKSEVFKWDRQGMIMNLKLFSRYVLLLDIFS